MKIETITVTLILLAAILILIIHLSMNNLEFNRYNLEWNGTSGFFHLTDRHTTIEITNLSDLRGKTNTTLLVIAPKKSCLPEECALYREYIVSGNTLFLADDFGAGNQIQKGIGSSIYKNPGTLASIDTAYRDPYSLVTKPASDHHITHNVSSLVLNRAAALDGGEPIIKTSIMSWIDEDGDRRATNEELGTYTVLASEQMGRGEIIVLSDPSIFINTMDTLDTRWDNRIFIQNIINNSPVLLIDQTNSKTSATEGMSKTIHDIRRSSIAKIALFGLILLILLILTKKKRIKNP